MWMAETGGLHPKWDVPVDELEAFDRNFILSGMSPSAKVVRVGVKVESSSPVVEPKVEEPTPTLVGSIVERKPTGKPVVFQPRLPPTIPIVQRSALPSQPQIDYDSINAENLSRIQAMSMEEIEEAQEQIRRTLPPKLLEKLSLKKPQ